MRAFDAKCIVSWCVCQTLLCLIFSALPYFAKNSVFIVANFGKVLSYPMYQNEKNPNVDVIFYHRDKQSNIYASIQTILYSFNLTFIKYNRLYIHEENIKNLVYYNRIYVSMNLPKALITQHLLSATCLSLFGEMLTLSTILRQG